MSDDTKKIDMMVNWAMRGILALCASSLSLLYYNMSTDVSVMRDNVNGINIKMGRFEERLVRFEDIHTAAKEDRQRLDNEISEIRKQIHGK